MAEGPSQGPDGRIYFSDITTTWMSGMQGGHLLAWDPRSGATEVFLSPSSMSNGIVFDSKGRMIVAHGADFGGRCVSRIDMTTRRSSIIAGLFNGKPFNAPNDVDVDAEDRVYFTDPRYIGHEAIEQPLMGVYRIDTDGTVELVIADCSRPNGVAVAPDGRHLYVVENNFVWFDRRTVPEVPPRYIEVQIVRYDIGRDGKLGNRHVFVDVAGEGGGPDGIEVDSEGNVYAAMQTAGTGCEGIRPRWPGNRQGQHATSPCEPHTGRCTDGSVRMYITATNSLLSISANVSPRRF